MSLCLVFAFSITSYGATVQDGVPIVFKDADGFYQGGTLLCAVNTQEYSDFEFLIANTIKADVENGYSKVVRLKTASSHIPLENTGAFLYKTLGKSVSEISSDIPTFKLEDGTTIKFNGDRATKSWIESFLKEKLAVNLITFNNDNIFSVYTVDTKVITPYSKFNLDDYGESDYKLVKELKPLSGYSDEISTLAVHNTGKNYSMQLDGNFIKVLNGSMDSTGGYKRLSQNSVLITKTSIGYPYTFEANKMTTANLIMDEVFGIDLETKELYSIDAAANGMSSDVGSFEDNKINPNNISFITMGDGIVAVFNNFSEVLNFNNNLYQTGYVVDMSDYYLGKDTVDVYLGESATQEPLTTYIQDTQLMNYGILESSGDVTLQVSKVALPLERLLKWSTTDNCIKQMGDTGRDNLKAALKAECKAKGKMSAYKAVYGTDGLIGKIGALGVIVLIVLIVMFVIKRKKKKDAMTVDTSFTEDVEVDAPLADEPSDDIITAQPKIKHKSRIKGLANRNKDSEVVNDFDDTVSEDKSMTDDTGFTSFDFDNDDDDDDFSDFTPLS